MARITVLQARPVNGVNWRDVTGAGITTPYPGQPNLRLRGYLVPTVKGNFVLVYKAIGQQPTQFQCNCHGFSFGGNSAPAGPFVIMTAEDVQQILADGWKTINWNQARPKDIVVWWDQLGRPIHSATLKKVVLNNKQANVNQTRLSTKNGLLPFQGNATLQSIIDSYGNNYTVYRLKP
jgi:hypothetical protein